MLGRSRSERLQTWTDAVSSYRCSSVGASAWIIVPCTPALTPSTIAWFIFQKNIHRRHATLSTACLTTNVVWQGRTFIIPQVNSRDHVTCPGPCSPQLSRVHFIDFYICATSYRFDLHHDLESNPLGEFQFCSYIQLQRFDSWLVVLDCTCISECH